MSTAEIGQIENRAAPSSTVTHGGDTTTFHKNTHSVRNTLVFSFSPVRTAGKTLPNVSQPLTIVSDSSACNATKITFGKCPDFNNKEGDFYLETLRNCGTSRELDRLRFHLCFCSSVLRFGVEP